MNITPNIFAGTLVPFWYTEPLRRGEKALGNGSAALLRLMYDPVHFQRPARYKQF